MEVIPDMTPDEARKAVRLLRQAKGMTQYDLAEDARVNRSKLSLYERGSLDLSEAELRRVRRALRMKSDETLKPADLRGISEIQRRKLRRQHVGLTQHQLAKLTGISQTKLSDYENGKAELTPSEETLWVKATDEAAERMGSDVYFKLRLAEEHNEELYNERRALLSERRDLLSKLESSPSIGDPIVQEVIASFRREIADLERRTQQRTGTESDFGRVTTLASLR